MTKWDKSKSVLWFQRETLSTIDTLLYDGKSVDDDFVRQQIFQYINHFPITGKSIWKLCYKVSDNKIKKQESYGYNLTPGLAYFRNRLDNTILISSHFKDLDEVGRRIVYLFYAPTSEMSEACKLLLDVTKCNGKTCNEDDLKFIDDIDKKRKKKSFYKKIIFILLIIILIFVLWQL